MYELLDLVDGTSYHACHDHMMIATNCNTSSDWSVDEIEDIEQECDYCECGVGLD